MKSYTRYICVNSEGKPVGVDTGSGYPYVPEWNGEPSWWSVQQYCSVEDAQNYANVFRTSEQFKLTVRKITITIED